MATPHETAQQRPDEHERLLSLLVQLARPLQASIPGQSEVVIHYLPQLPNSIVAIEGDVTGRRVGDPATNTLLEAAAQGQLKTNIGYTTRAPDDRTLSSSTVIVTDSSGEGVAALCINRDVTKLLNAQEIIRELLPEGDETPASSSSVPPAQAREKTDERFVRDVDELTQLLLHEAVTEQGADPQKLTREQRVAAVVSLKDRGFFLLRDAAEQAASALGVSRFTIYNYLNESVDEEDESHV